jgi:type IV secretion system protein VirB3
MPVQEDIFKGATRPAMKLGVPLVPLVIIVCVSMLLIIWGGSLLSWWMAPFVFVSAVLVVIWMRLVTKKDDQRLRQMYLRMLLGIPQVNRRFWKARSYAPVQWRGMKDGYRR